MTNVQKTLLHTAPNSTSMDVSTKINVARDGIRHILNDILRT